MKKNILSYIFVGMLTVFTMGSCDFLKENPTTSLSETSVYSTESALEAQIYGVLEGFYGDYMMQGYMNELLHTASGLLVWKGQRTQDMWTDGFYFAKYSTTSANQNWYAQLYSAISRCNRLLDNLPGSPVDEAFKAEIDGEARFYRAVLYYYLVRMYGDVPLITSCPKNINDTNKPRTAYYKIYAQIIDDLTVAEENMRDKARVETVSPSKGRPCKWAATAMKASVYMTIGSMLTSFEADPEDQFFDTTKDAELIAAGKDPRTPNFSLIEISSARDAWELALSTADNVIENGPYRLASDYRQLFSWTNPEDFTLDERIFVLQSTNTSALENRLALMSLPMYPEGSSNTEIKANNYGRFRPSRFLFQKFAEDNGGVKGTAATNKEIYVQCPDPRFNTSFFHTSYIRLDKGKAQTLYPNSKCINVSDGTTAFPYFKKYLDPKYDNTTGYADFYLMRLAEIYLISAEAAATLSTGEGDAYWTKALERIESLHARARKSTDGEEAAFPTWKDRTFESPSDLVNAIIWERAYEMCGEGHEYFDTHRKGAKWLAEQIAAPLNEHLQRPEQAANGDANGGVWKYCYVSNVYPTSQSDLRKSLLCAFPASTEATYNTAIDPIADQNDFYWK